MRAPIRGAAIVAVTFAMALFLSGCQDFLNTLLDTAAPIGVSASDGDYPDRVEVSWSAPSLSSDKWEGYEVDHYHVSWDSKKDHFGSFDDFRSTSCTISSAAVADLHTVSVETVLRYGFSTDFLGGLSSDTGFAMDADPLIWEDGGSVYTIEGADQWYETMLQKGFAYRFTFAGGGTGSVTFYPYKSLDPVEAPISAPAPTWTCDEDGKGHKFYVHVMPNGAGNSFTAMCDLGWGFGP